MRGLRNEKHWRPPCQNEQLKITSLEELRIAMPTIGIEEGMYKRVWAFVKKSPLIAITLNVTYGQIDTLKAGFDLAIQLGETANHSFNSCKVGETRLLLVASPGYL